MLNRKYLLTILSIAFTTLSLAQESKPAEAFQIIDVSQKELRIMNALKSADSVSRSKIFADSLYHPYEAFWSGYIGSADSYVGWVNDNVIPSLNQYNHRNTQIDGKKLLTQFDEVKERMTSLTGYSPRGRWYIVYGPAWANLGGLSGGTMFIDLAHENNSSNENIMMMFPHELTHQIYSNVNTHNDTTAMGSIIGEGFAVYMNQLYWKDKYSLARNLGYSDAELAEVEQNKELVMDFFNTNKFGTGRATIDKFRNRSFHLRENMPGAIGYYIGYRIIESYVSKHGADSWKDVFTRAPKEIYADSGY